MHFFLEMSNKRKTNNAFGDVPMHNIELLLLLTNKRTREHNDKK